MQRKGNLFEKFWSHSSLWMPPEETPERTAAELLRETQDADLIRVRAMADAHHFYWLKQHLLTVLDRVPFDVTQPIRSYAQFFNRTEFPAGRESRIEHVVAEARCDVQVIPGIEHSTRR